MARIRAVVVATVAATLAGAVGWWAPGTQSRSISVVVTRVVDGDTIEVRGRNNYHNTVRLLNVDTPETHHPRKPVQCFGPEASAYTTSRLLGRHVKLQTDVVRHDIYGRLLAYVNIDGERFNDELLRLGYARFLVIPPNVSHARTMLREQLDAQHSKVGLWGACEDADVTQ